MIVLGVESSCDETAAALVRDDGMVLADVVASQLKVHAPFGGVVPELASREHMRAVMPVISQALVALPGGIADVDVVAATAGPGLAGALLVGLQAAKTLAWARGLPFIGVDHLRGHLLAVHLRREGEASTAPSYPYVALLASGGHTALYHLRSPMDVELLGETRDDAAGEAYDKLAKMLGLGYPGGPIVDRLAAKGDPKAVALPSPMMHHHHYNFSFSGLKTAVRRHLEKHGAPQGEQALADLCASFQRAVVEVLVRKAVSACSRRDYCDLVLTGGVAANRGLRARAAEMCEQRGLALHVPPVASCTDNAAMIAFAGLKAFESGTRDGPTLRSYSRSSLGRAE